MTLQVPVKKQGKREIDCPSYDKKSSSNFDLQDQLVHGFTQEIVVLSGEFIVHLMYG